MKEIVVIRQTMNTTFRALAEEATFTKEILASGVTQIRNANYTRKGVYFQSFTSLATGLERIGKLCLMLDYYIKNNGHFPDMKFVKKHIGHDLILLYTKSKDIVNEYNVAFNFQSNIDGLLHQEILSILSAFAKGDRYSNIDFLVTQSRDSDPIFEWYNRVDRVLYEQRVSVKKRKTIESSAAKIGKKMFPFTMVRHSSESRNEVNSIRDASHFTGMTIAITKYRQLYLLQIIRYWVELLIDLQHRASGINNADIPFFTEIFSIFYNDDKYFLTRKTFD